MTERKPTGVSFESWVEQQISEAVRRGDFENLPGIGKPLPPGDADEDWWLRGYLKREGVTGDAALPTPLLLRKEAEEIDATVRGLRSADEVRRVVTALNDRIVDSWRSPSVAGVIARTLDVETVVERWRAARQATDSEEQQATADKPTADKPVVPPRRRWWHRLTQSRGEGERH
jgi:hypothetical protein